MTIHEYLFILSVTLTITHYICYQQVVERCSYLHREIWVHRFYLAQSYVIFYILNWILG